MHAAASVVAARIAPIGVMPQRTNASSPFATSSWGYTPLSVPYVIRTPSSIARRNAASPVSIVSASLRIVSAGQRSSTPCSSAHSPSYRSTDRKVPASAIVRIASSVEHRAVLDGPGSRPHRAHRALVRVRVDRDELPVVRRLLDGGPQLVLGQLGRRRGRRPG